MNRTNPQAWIACLSEIESDPRPNRTRNLLIQAGYKVDPLQACVDSNYSRSRLYSFSLLATKLLQFHLGIRREAAVKAIMEFQYKDFKFRLSEVASEDLLIVHDLDYLAFLSEFRSRNRIILDLREIYLAQHKKSTFFRILIKPVRSYLLTESKKYVSDYITVSKGLKNYYENEHGIESNIIRSMPHFNSEKSSPDAHKPIRIVYLGVAHPVRGLDESLKIVAQSCAGIEFHAYLVGDSAYIESLKEDFKKETNIYFHNPVSFDQIHQTLCQYDLGWCLFFPNTLNLVNALPNKYFEYVQAGLGLVIGPTTTLIEESKIWGFAAAPKSFDSRDIQELLDTLTVDCVISLKSHASKASHFLNFEEEAKMFLNIMNGGRRA